MLFTARLLRDFDKGHSEYFMKNTHCALYFVYYDTQKFLSDGHSLPLVGELKMAISSSPILPSMRRLWFCYP